MIKPLQILGQLAAFALFAALLAYFSTAPSYTYLEPNQAVIKVSFRHAAARGAACRRLTADEIAELPPNMRRTMDCPRERLPILVEMELDGRRLISRLLPPTGLHSDGASSIYERFAVPAGRHRLVARLRDTARAEGFDYEQEAEIELVPGQSFVVEFRAEAGGFIFM